MSGLTTKWDTKLVLPQIAASRVRPSWQGGRGRYKSIMSPEPGSGEKRSSRVAQLRDAGSDALPAARNRAGSLMRNWLCPPGWHHEVNKFHRCQEPIKNMCGPASHHGVDLCSPQGILASSVIAGSTPAPAPWQLKNWAVCWQRGPTRPAPTLCKNAKSAFCLKAPMPKSLIHVMKGVI